MLSENQIITAILSAFLSGGTAIGVVKLYVKNEAIEATKPLFEEIKTLVELKQNKEVCMIHHHNLDERLKSIDKKLDILIEQK